RISAEIRSATLFERNLFQRAVWAQELPKALRKRFIYFKRGFAFGIGASATQLARSANTLSRKTAIQQVDLEGVKEETAARLGGLPLLGRLRSLVGVGLSAAEPWARLLASPMLTGLERVTLSGYQAERHAGLSRLLEAPAVRGVRILEPTFLYDARYTAPR